MNTENNAEEKVSWGGNLNEFLWICAGANREVLRQCPTDYAKYAGIGGTILFTALMAVISSSYALYFVFKSYAVAIPFGIFWGLLIFNLDRFIVNTMYSDGKVTISWREFTCGLPRIIMAIFLGIVISTPLEMKIFEDRISSQLEKDNIERTNETIAIGQEGNVSVKNDLRELQNRKSAIESEKRKLDEQKRAIEDELAKANKALMEEAAGISGNGVGEGQVYNNKKVYLNSVETRLNQWKAEHKSDYERIIFELDQINNQIDFLQSQVNVRSSKIEEDVKRANEENGFCARYEAFARLKSENPSLDVVSLVIMLLFVIIETAPTFFKMMIASGPYDDYLRAEMHKIRVLSDKRISDLNDLVNTEVQISTQKNIDRLDAEIKSNQELMEKLSKAQADLLQSAIDKWKKEELAKISKDPSSYIKTGKK